VRSRRSCVFQDEPVGTRVVPNNARAISRYVAPARCPSRARNASASLRLWSCVRLSGELPLGRPLASLHKRVAASALVAKSLSSGMTTAAGVSMRALMSTAVSRSSLCFTSQYSPSTAERRSAGLSRLMLRALPNIFGAGATAIVAGSKRGNHMSCARSPGDCGSTGKPEPPAACQSLWELGLGGCPSGGCSKVAAVVGIAAKEFPSKLGAVEVLQVGVGGRISPVGCCWHVGSRNDAILIRVARPRHQ
jgi:hypothetical protein